MKTFKKDDKYYFVLDKQEITTLKMITSLAYLYTLKTNLNLIQTRKIYYY